MLRSLLVLSVGDMLLWFLVFLLFALIFKKSYCFVGKETLTDKNVPRKIRKSRPQICMKNPHPVPTPEKSDDSYSTPPEDEDINTPRVSASHEETSSQESDELKTGVHAAANVKFLPGRQFSDSEGIKSEFSSEETSSDSQEPNLFPYKTRGCRDLRSNISAGLGNVEVGNTETSCRKAEEYVAPTETEDHALRGKSIISKSHLNIGCPRPGTFGSNFIHRIVNSEDLIQGPVKDLDLSRSKTRSNKKQVRNHISHLKPRDYSSKNDFASRFGEPSGEIDRCSKQRPNFLINKCRKSPKTTQTHYWSKNDLKESEDYVKSHDSSSSGNEALQSQDEANRLTRSFVKELCTTNGVTSSKTKQAIRIFCQGESDVSENEYASYVQENLSGRDRTQASDNVERLPKMKVSRYLPGYVPPHSTTDVYSENTGSLRPGLFSHTQSSNDRFEVTCDNTTISDEDQSETSVLEKNSYPAAQRRDFLEYAHECPSQSDNSHIPSGAAIQERPNFSVIRRCRKSPKTRTEIQGKNDFKESEDSHMKPRDGSCGNEALQPQDQASRRTHRFLKRPFTTNDVNSSQNPQATRMLCQGENDVPENEDSSSVQENSSEWDGTQTSDNAECLPKMKASMRSLPGYVPAPSTTNDYNEITGRPWPCIYLSHSSSDRLQVARDNATISDEAQSETSGLERNVYSPTQRLSDLEYAHAYPFQSNNSYIPSGGAMQGCQFLVNVPMLPQINQQFYSENVCMQSWSWQAPYQPVMRLPGPLFRGSYLPTPSQWPYQRATFQRSFQTEFR